MHVEREGLILTSSNDFGFAVKLSKCYIDFVKILSVPIGELWILNPPHLGITLFFHKEQRSLMMDHNHKMIKGDMP